LRKINRLSGWLSGARRLSSNPRVMGSSPPRDNSFCIKIFESEKSKGLNGDSFQFESSNVYNKPSGFGKDFFNFCLVILNNKIFPNPIGFVDISANPIGFGRKICN
jgi:hypothetical protein